VAFYVFALPLALLLGFQAKLGVIGLFMGMGVGPLVQSLLYSIVVFRLDWAREARRAVDHASKEEAAALERSASEAAQAPLLATHGSAAAGAEGEEAPAVTGPPQRALENGHAPPVE
jgi:MATE family multidrug resistance protein